MCAQIRDQRIGDRLGSADRYRPAHGVRERPAASRAAVDRIDGIGEIVCAATPVNSARHRSPRSQHSTPGCPGHASAGRVAARSPDPVGSDRLSPSRNPTTPSTCCDQRPEAACRHDSPSSSPAAGALQVAVRDRGGPVGSGLAYEISGPPSRTPRAGRSNSAKNGEPSAERVHRRADVVAHVGIFGVGQRAGAAAQGRLALRAPAPTDRLGRRRRLPRVRWGRCRRR